MPHFAIIDVLPCPTEAGLIHLEAVENCAKDHMYIQRLWSGAHNNYSESHIFIAVMFEQIDFAEFMQKFAHTGWNVDCQIPHSANSLILTSETIICSFYT